MTKRWFLIGMLCVTLALGLILAGCTSTDVKYNLSGSYNAIPKIASKDFIPLGLVSVTAIETEIISPFHFMKDWSGEGVTFDMLLQEAKRLYPETSDIINIRIDRIFQSRTTLVDFFTGSTRTWKDIGNALAIKYTDALEEVRDPLSGRYYSLPSY